MIRSIVALALTVSCLTGCTGLAHVVWPCDPGKPCPISGARETPEAAVDYLIDSFRSRRVADIHSALHPDFIAANGGFTIEEFALAYEKFEKDFSADAENLAVAQRSATAYGDGRRTATIVLTNASTGAEFPIEFRDRPKIRLVTTDAFVRTIEGPVDIDALVKLDEGRLTLPSNFDLTSIANVQKATVAPLKSADVARVEITHDWLVANIDPARAKNIRFLDKLKEYTAK